MCYNACLLPQSVIADVDSIQMPTLQVCVWAETAGIGVSQLGAEAMRIWQEKSDLTTQQIKDNVRERIFDITQSMSIINKQGPGSAEWDLLINHFITQICNLATVLPLWILYMPPETDLDGQKLRPLLDEFTAVGFRRRKLRLYKTPTGKRKLVYIGMYYITPMLYLILPMMWKFSRQWGRYLR